MKKISIFHFQVSKLCQSFKKKNKIDKKFIRDLSASFQKIFRAIDKKTGKLQRLISEENYKIYFCCWWRIK